MIDRRRFMVGSMAVAATLTASPLRAAGVVPRTCVIAIVDRTLYGSASFAASARARGLPLFEFASDVAALWMRELEPRLRLGLVVFEAHTSAATQFCLEYLARDYGARTVRRTESGDAVTWLLSSLPARRAALAPLPSRWSKSHG
jgi:hypothetical protein